MRKVGVIILALAVFVAERGLDVSGVESELAAIILWAVAGVLLALGVLLFAVPLLKRIRLAPDDEADAGKPEPTAVRFDVKSEGQIGGQTAGVIQNVRQQPRTLRNANGDEKKDGKDGE